MLLTVLFYTFLSSAVFIYGIGLSRLTFYSQSPRLYLIKLFKFLCSVSASSSLSYLFSVNLLTKEQLTDMIPFVTVLILIAVSSFIETILRLSAKTSTAEFAISFLCVLLALYESTSLSECVLISVACMLSIFILVPAVNTIRKRSAATGKTPKDIFIVLLTIAIIMIIALWWNTSWLNGEVFK
ncbi:hypothetical protein [Treponema sp.]|uniref:hypothetical protein n=1 Tax=Treponema sp. TaxID=166 RepID=UPI0025802385|nr:hypothetical protein [Treponema sp.]MBE6353897.1 hypothetical protein [Treponema sp.]